MSEGMQPVRPNVTFVFDAYCGWCFGFEPLVLALAEQRGDAFDLNVLSGGLFVGDLKAPIRTFPHIARANAEIEDRGVVRFGEPYLALLAEGSFVMDSADAARGFAALRSLQPDSPVRLAAALQDAFFVRGESLSAEATYRRVAHEHGIDADEVALRFASPDYVRIAQEDFAAARALGAEGYPALIARFGDQLEALPTYGMTANDLVGHIAMTAAGTD
jgi:putative protein-disulfide isomerase